MELSIQTDCRMNNGFQLFGFLTKIMTSAPPPKTMHVYQFREDFNAFNVIMSTFSEGKKMYLKAFEFFAGKTTKLRLYSLSLDFLFVFLKPSSPLTRTSSLLSMSLCFRFCISPFMPD